MEGDFIKLNKWLQPLSWLYGLAVNCRNMLFSMGILKSRSFDVPVISVGNITVGGSGKTPHVEYLIRLLKDNFRTAVLSRGYKRKSKGFVQASSETTMPQIGDEPYQMKQKFPDVTVAVDKELVDYHRLIIYDRLLPVGRLREPLSGKNRADIVIVTKCPKELKPMGYRVITKAMNLFPYQQLFFTSIEYGALYPLFDKSKECLALKNLKDHHAVLLTGIASPRQMTHDLEPLIPQLTPLTFSDHHNFTAKDVELINSTFAALPSPKLIITTEKDATRLNMAAGLSEEVRSALYVLPIIVCFLQDQATVFNQQIIDYVHKNSRNSILVKRKDEHKSQDCHHSGDRPRTISFRNY